MLARLAYPPQAHVHWRYPPSDVDADRAEIFVGELCMHNLAAALTKKELSFVNIEESPGLDSLAPYRILDEHPLIGDARMTLVRLNDDSTDVELYFLRDWQPHRLALTFEEYAWCQTFMLGYANWQNLFCDDASLAAGRIVRKDLAEKIRSDLNKVWPGEDLSEFFTLATRAG
jgi:hypothetical protein